MMIEPILVVGLLYKSVDNLSDLSYNTYIDTQESDMTYKGFTYSPEIELEDDNRKIYHEILFNGKRVQPPYWFQNISPYTYPTNEEFQRAVDEIYFENWVENG
jgi:hypothetical protein